MHPVLSNSKIQPLDDTVTHIQEHELSIIGRRHMVDPNLDNNDHGIIILGILSSRYCALTFVWWWIAVSIYRITHNTSYLDIIAIWVTSDILLSNGRARYKYPPLGKQHQRFTGGSAVQVGHSCCYRHRNRQMVWSLHTRNWVDERQIIEPRNEMNMHRPEHVTWMVEEFQ